jgi:hypothetical protein
VVTAARLLSQVLGALFAVAAAIALGGVAGAIVAVFAGGEVLATDVVGAVLVSCVLAGNAYLFLVYLPMRPRKNPI